MVVFTVIKYITLGYTLPVLDRLWYAGLYQSAGPLSQYGVSSPNDNGAALFNLFYNNTPVSTGEYVDIDASHYAGLGASVNPMLRFNSNASAGQLPLIGPSTAPNGGLLTKANWSKVYARAFGNAGPSSSDEKAWFQSAINVYNKGGLCPRFGL